MNEWINFFLLYTVVVSINKIGFHISRPETNIDMMWKIALSNPWLYSACRAFFPACGVIHETFTSLSNPWLYWGAFRDDTKNGCVADYTINWYVQTFDRRLILTWCEKSLFQIPTSMSESLLRVILLPSIVYPYFELSTRWIRKALFIIKARYWTDWMICSLFLNSSIL